MKKTQTQFVCSQCGFESVQWYGKCPNCAAWNTMVEFREVKKTREEISRQNRQGTRPQKLSEIKSPVSRRLSLGVGEFDRVLGGGFIQGSVVLLAGEPGVGKSTLLLQLAKENKISKISKSSFPFVFYVSGEESVEQIKLRAERLGITGEDLLLLSETNLERIIEEISNSSKDKKDNENVLVVIDSIQTLWSEEIEGESGGISQVKGCSQKLLEYAKKNGVTMIIVGHINKEGGIAGPMMLSHMVDVVLFLEGERFVDLRLLRGIKNRFGPTDEVGVFKMGEKGMEEVTNPSELFLQEGGEIKNKAGNVVVCAVEGTRPMLLEIQALVTKSSLAIPRRVALGLNYNRVLLLSAVIQKSLNLPLYDQDIIVKVAGGFKIDEPAADLGVCLAIISSLKDQPLPPKTCVFGEIGLLGEIRRVSGEEKRKKEAQKLGFTNIVAFGKVKDLREAVKAVGK